jgi:AraC-like DNA-binding protein
MEPVALKRASELIQVTDLLERLGMSPERTLRQAKLPMWHYCDPDDPIPAHHISVLMGQAARSLGNPAFGVLVGADSSLATMGSFGRLVASALSTYHALETGCRLIRQHCSDARHWLIEIGDEVWYCGKRAGPPEAGRRQMEQYVLMRMIDHVRLTAGPSWRPAKVFLQTREVPEPELREALDDPEIRIGQDFTGIAFPCALLAQPLQRRGTPAWDKQEKESRLRHTAPISSFVDSLRQLAGTLLKEGPPQVETMAEIAGLSVRSLQRHLAKNGLSHSQLVDQARYQAATRLLEDADIRITDIAMELSYTDSANFTRAFKRWAGVTPREYRRHQQMQ